MCKRPEQLWQGIYQVNNACFIYKYISIIEEDLLIAFPGPCAQDMLLKIGTDNIFTWGPDYVKQVSNFVSPYNVF